MKITPIDFNEANAFVKNKHRHHKPMVGCKFCIAVSDDNKVVGVVIVGELFNINLEYNIGVVPSVSVVLLVLNQFVPPFIVP